MALSKISLGSLRYDLLFQSSISKGAYYSSRVYGGATFLTKVGNRINYLC